MRVAPPTMTTPSMSVVASFASRSAFLIGAIVLATQVWVIAVDVSVVSVAEIVSQEETVASRVDEPWLVRFSFASRAFIINSRVSAGDTGSTRWGFKAQQKNRG